MTCVRLNPRTRDAPYSYPFDPGVLVWSPLVVVGLQAIIPNGRAAPGHVFPPRLDPMNGSTYGTGSPTSAGAAAPAGTAGPIVATSAAATTAAATPRVRVTSILHLRSARGTGVRYGGRANAR
ncbi:hypothetical protein Sya03_53710 [Spirilliplanes yamanashiensis]|uniref:Uncharacterized protein n=1 Tax=Spirilliplanes yamanashiensis TaxID=42233 RepID=A0A8J3YDD9_9ACTN|nr:hypothetical protein Sya03_53710 [Spirilliplanes yamanashiensis]